MPEPRSSAPKLLLLLFLSFSFLPVPGSEARQWWRIEIDGYPLDAEVVITDSEQQLGLGNRFSLPEGQSMLFLYEKPGERIFWMKGMYFSIDIIWYRDYTAVMIEEEVPFPRTPKPDRDLTRYGHGVLADMVLELPAGYIRRHRIEPGHQLRILNRGQ